MTGLFEPTYASSHIVSSAIEILLRDNLSLKKLYFNSDCSQIEITPLEFDDSIKTLSSGETVLAYLALEIWCAPENSPLSGLIYSLDSRRYHNYIRAMDLLRGTSYSLNHNDI